MSRARLHVLRATIEARPVYTCTRCGANEQGDRVTLTVDTPDNFERWLADQTVNNTYMPVGWSGYGLFSHLCQRCTQAH